MKALLDSWADLLEDSEGPQVFAANEGVFATLDRWPRIRWFYYCDDHNGNTIRLYDTEHFSHFGGGYYLEEDGVGREHRERVIIRGENMWGGKQVDKNGPDSPRSASGRSRLGTFSVSGKVLSARGSIRQRTSPCVPESATVMALESLISRLPAVARYGCGISSTSTKSQRSIFRRQHCTPVRSSALWCQQRLSKHSEINPPGRSTHKGSGRVGDQRFTRSNASATAIKPVPPDDSDSTANNATKQIEYRQRGFNLVSVVLVPSICYERLVVFSANANNETGWAIRDFIDNRMLDNEHSARTRASVEAEIRRNHSEYPPFYNVGDPGHAERWEMYLILRTSAHHRLTTIECSTTPPNSVQGDTWRAISSGPHWARLVL